MAFPVYDVVATTIEHRNKELADNVTNGTQLLVRLQSKNKIRTFDGGTYIREELEYAENGTVGWYSGYETLDITPQQTFDAADYDIKQLAGVVSISGLEELQNSGKERMIPLLTKRMENLEKSLKNEMGRAVFSDGTVPKQVHGLRFLVQDTPSSSSVVGGINQQSQAWWRNQVETGVVVTPGSENILAKMNALWLKCIRNNDKPDMIILDGVFYPSYESLLQQQQRYTASDSAVKGFTSLKYKSADVVYDENCPASHGYFLNTDYLYLRPHKDRQYKPLSKRDSLNQDATVVPVVWAGNLTCSNRSLQGVLTA